MPIFFIISEDLLTTQADTYEENLPAKGKKKKEKTWVYEKDAD